jgi:hypothetical protein
MSITRRALTLIGLTAAVLLVGGLPASATFSEAVAVPTAVGTATIAPPTQVEARTLCSTTVDPVTQVATTTSRVKIEWWASTSPRTTGYRVTVHPAGAPAYTLTTTGPTDEVFTSSTSIGGSNPRISVTTLTGTNFTATSVQVRVEPC